MLYRTILNIPANSPKMMLNADLMGADIILFDLEDGVALQQKEAARDLLHAFLSSGLSRCTAMVRVNNINTPFFLEDITTALGLPIQGIMLPKMERPEEILYVDEAMRKIEEKNNSLVGSHIIIGTAETALGVENAFACLTSCDRIVGCSFGGEDFAVSLGVQRSTNNDELDYARRHLVVSAKAAKKIAIDTVFTDVNDDDGLRELTSQGKQLGYSGKFVISPRQIPIIHAIYTPSADEITYAQQVVEKMRRAYENGAGTTVLDGKMLDKPVLQQAEEVLKMAKAAGVLGGQKA